MSTLDNTRPYRGSHLPLLMGAVQATSGPILELGCGVYSTLYLHWACYATKRKLVSYEDNPRYFPFANQFRSDYHDVINVENGAWDSVDLSGPYSVVLVDQGSEAVRVAVMPRLVHIDYVVCHDTGGGRRYNHNGVRDAGMKVFKYAFHYDLAFPATSVFSSIHDLKEFKPA